MIAKLNGIAVLAVTLFSVALPSMGADWKPASSTLTTPWTAKVSPDHVLPDYPRPQMVRKQWANLNGLWEYAVQDKDASSLKLSPAISLCRSPLSRVFLV